MKGFDQDSQATLSAALKANKDLNARLQASKSQYGALRRLMARLVGGMTRWGKEEGMLRQQLASAQRAEEEMRDKLGEERKAKEDSQKNLEASRRRIDAFKGDLERLRGERDTLRQQCAEMHYKLDKERGLRSAMEARRPVVHAAARQAPALR
jgi:chromosome segregation ATPase